ncbi:MAG TPA: amidohydrolase family protein [Firmicutes bacterium]|nr:amidohydrolase family protein [Bacillota bacterium]
MAAVSVPSTPSIWFDLEHARRVGFTVAPPRKVDVPLIDVHTHAGRRPDTVLLLDAARRYGVTRLVTIAPLDECLWLQERYPDRIIPATTLTYDHRDDPARLAAENLALLERAVAAGLKVVKFWFKPRFNADTGLKLDDARLAPIFRFLGRHRMVALVHIADPDAWWQKYYTDPTRYDSKEATYLQAERAMAAYPEVRFILAHLGGDPEHLDHLDRLLSTYPNLYLDTSATKWLVRELGRQPETARAFFQRWPDRILFGTDQVVRVRTEPACYTSRYWVHQIFWETGIVCPSPIPDADSDGPPMIHGLNLPAEVLRSVYYENAVHLLFD